MRRFGGEFGGLAMRHGSRGAKRPHWGGGCAVATQPGMHTTAVGGHDASENPPILRRRDTETNRDDIQDVLSVALYFSTLGTATPHRPHALTPVTTDSYSASRRLSSRRMSGWRSTA